MVIVVDCKFIAQASQVRILLSPIKDKWLSGLKHLSWKQKYRLYHGFESRLVWQYMKRVNPLIIRLFLNINHQYHLLVKNLYKNFKFYYYITNLLIFSLQRISILNKFVLIFNYCMLLRSNGLYLFFQYFFIIKKIYFNTQQPYLMISSKIKQKKKTWIFFLTVLFWRLEACILKFYNLPIYLLTQNIYNFLINIKNYHYLFSKQIFKNYKKYCRLILLTNLGLYLKSSVITTYCICQAIRRNKKHQQSLNWFVSILKFLLKYQPTINGILIKVSGRFNNNIQSKHRIISLGKQIKLNTYSTQLNYAYRTIITPIGIFGIKVWMI